MKRSSPFSHAGPFIGLVLMSLPPVFLSSSNAGQNSIGPTTLTLKATFESISVRAAYTGDANGNARAAIRFRRAGSAMWQDAYTPVVDRRLTVQGRANPYVNEFRGSIVGLDPGTTYEVRVVVVDADGVSTGPNDPRDLLNATTMSGTVMTIPSVPPLGGRDWYVDAAAATTGDGSATNPFPAIPNALAVVSPGDTIHVRPGSYAPFTIGTAGLPSAWIAIVGDDRDTTVITGGGVTNNITINGDFLQIRNLRFKQTLDNSVEVTANHHHIWLDNLYHEDVSASQSYSDGGVHLRTGNHHVYVLNNIILAPGLTAAPAAVPRYNSPVDGIHVDGAMSTEGTFVFKGNTIIGGFRDCIGNSLESYGGSTRDNTDIAYNTVSGCKDDAIQMEGDDINLRIWGNDITADNGPAAIATQSSIIGPVYAFRNVMRVTWTVSAGDAFKIGGAVYTFYFHNTIYTSGAAHDGFGGTGSIAQVLRNNIIVTEANPLYCMGDAGGSTYDYNLYFRLTTGNLISRWNCVSGANYTTIDAFYAATGQEAHGLSANPLFTDAALDIGTSSPAYDRGTVIPNFNDANSAWPYAGSAPDLGAREYGQPPETPQGFHVVTP